MKDITITHFNFIVRRPLQDGIIKEDFPHLSSYPHHYHDINGAVLESCLSGDPFQDFPIVLREIERIIALV